MSVDLPPQINEFHELQLKVNQQDREISRLKIELAQARKNNLDYAMAGQSNCLDRKELNEISLLIHELNQPLTAVLAYSYSCLNLIKKNAAQDKLIYLLGELVEQTERTGSILQKMKNIL